ncbi:ribonuclease HI family protein [Candidatus Micrarchaeota archaeon]|nr:ribonuclease HI family protein [Candidatus Micrarchaeota archaeon]
MNIMLIIYTDGCCLGNPGKMGIGAVIQKDGKTINEVSKFIGQGTNNIAEYEAVIKALEGVKDVEGEILVRSDSQLLVRQLNNEYKVKMPHLKKLKAQVDSLILNKKIRFEHIPREENERADYLSKKGAESGN